MTSFAYAHSPLNRLANLRTAPSEIAKRLANPRARHVSIAGDTVRLNGHGLDLRRLDGHMHSVFLGDDQEGLPWFAVSSTLTDSHKAIRSVMVEGQMSPNELSIVAQARSLIHWHDTHRFCARCGKPSEMRDAGYRRHCTACSADHFPRLDPVVIMAVTNGRRSLLCRQSSWPEGMYSTLAGFMEPGETIEDAVRREVFEEVGLDVKKVSYVASQPWPFPSSLMIGMIGEVSELSLKIDHNEIEIARWFEAAELRLMLAGKHPEGLHASRPDAIAWHLLHAALQRIEA